uniref:Small ribosomal subunit protein uS2c n=1 Tax=Eutreptia sp. CCAC 1914B TaxID=2979827 RepID=A0A977K7W9_9EUGL|nr:ribosomal protein S2 [Eutreptia sp. CCAC 1914B]
MITLEKMLESGVHLGHEVRRWNPKMVPYIYGRRKNIHIIDILQTFVCLDKISRFLFKIGSEKKNVLFVCTKRQFSSIVQECALRSNSYYVNKRWLGGMLTNWSTIQICVENLKLLNKQSTEGNFENLTKKEISILNKRKEKLEKYFDGIKNMSVLPDVVIIVDQIREFKAVCECIKLKIPIITIVDTNCDPTLTDFLVPGNDDSIRSVSLLLNELTSYIIKGQNKILE